MGDITLKKVILVVLLLMILAPLFDSDIYTDQANSMDYTINNINYLLRKPADISLDDINKILNQVLDDHKE